MTEIAFTGDIAFSKHFKDSWADEQCVSAELCDFLNSADHVIPNVEGALTDAVMTRGSSSVPSHASNPKAAERLVQFKSDIWNLSNNHTLDCGEQGLDDTVKLAASYGCRTLGAGGNIDEASRPTVLKEAGGIGLLSVCYKLLFAAGKDTPGILGWNEYALIKKRIREIKRENRWCVMIVHGGEEFSDIPLPTVRKRYLKYLKFGADVIVAHHPHTPQNYETARDKTIFYSLGNFIFDTDYQRLQKHTDQGILLKLKFTEDRVSWDSMPYRIDRELHRVVPSERPAIFRNITAREFKRLSPLAIKSFLEKYGRAKIFLKPHMADYSKLQWVRWYIKEKGIKMSASLLLGSIRYRFGKWKKCDKEIIDYLK